MNRVPRYHQIARSLRERIAAGTLAPGERLDNQRSLAREYEVTLMTLRQALELLEREGLITRRHGLGTFVASPPIARTWPPGFSGAPSGDRITRWPVSSASAGPGTSSLWSGCGWSTGGR